MHKTKEQTKNPAQQAPSVHLDSATSFHFQLSPKHILDSLNQTEFSTAAGLQAFSFFSHVLLWADNRLKRKDLTHSLSMHHLQLFQYGMFYSQSCISLYWWFFVHMTHSPRGEGSAVLWSRTGTQTSTVCRVLKFLHLPPVYWQFILWRWRKT